MKKFTLLLSFITISIITTLLITGCGTTQQASPQAELEHIDLGVGFVPNIQFAPFYVAQAKGFFAEEGLDVALEYGYENDFVVLTAQGERQFAVASGDQVILARTQGLPVVYVMKWSDKFPVGIAALAESGISTPQDLIGRTVGIPGSFGASFIAWKALIYSNNLDESALDLKEIGFTQAEALSQGNIDAAIVYVNNEPIQLQQAGLDVNTIELSNYINLVSNGIVTNEKLIDNNPDLVKRMVRASIRGLVYTIKNPDEAFTLSRTFIPDMTDEDAPIQKIVLEASIKQWITDKPGISSPQAWADSAKFMLEMGIIDTAVKVDDFYTNDFISD